MRVASKAVRRVAREADLLVEGAGEDVDCRGVVRDLEVDSVDQLAGLELGGGLGGRRGEHSPEEGGEGGDEESVDANDHCGCSE